MAGTNFTYTEFSAGTAIVAAHTNANNSAIDTAVTQVLNGTKSHSAFQATGTATLSGATTLSGVTTISTLATFTAATTTFNGATPLTFEGATADAYETTLAVTDPTADRTITLPNAEGTVALTNGTIATATLAETVTVADAGSDATLFPLLATDGTGSEAVFADASALTYNASNGALSATTFVGALTGNVTGSVLTAAQTAITSVGTLTDLYVSGQIRCNGAAADNALQQASTPGTGIHFASATDIRMTISGSSITRTKTGEFRSSSHDRDKLGINGQAWSECWVVDGAFNGSDMRYKTALGDVLGLDFILDLEPFSGEWTAKAGRTHEWLSAQQVRETLTAHGRGDTVGMHRKAEIDTITEEPTDDGYESINYSELIPVLIKAVQELTVRLEALETA